MTRNSAPGVPDHFNGKEDTGYHKHEPHSHHSEISPFACMKRHDEPYQRDHQHGKNDYYPVDDPEKIFPVRNGKDLLPQG